MYSADGTGMLWFSAFLGMLEAEGMRMDHMNKMKIGQATYEISRVFDEKQTVSDIIQTVLASKTRESLRLT